MMELSEMKSPSLSGPAGEFWRKSIFRLCLFLDIWRMVRGFQFEILGALVMLVKIDGTLFL